VDSPPLEKALELMMATKTIPARHRLVEKLVDRIRDPVSLEEPYIVQDRVPQTHSRHVVVIWDAWDRLGGAERAKIITDAFEDAGIPDAIRVAMGITHQEALDMGYLPYQTVSNWKKSDGEEVRQAIKKAIEKTPGIRVQTGSSSQLRYPTIEHAQEAYRRLSEVVPGPYWAIIKQDNAID
jgi:hypothetical protein